MNISDSIKNKICNAVDSKRDVFIEVSDKVWEYAELGFKEYKSAETICKALENEGFDIKKGVAGISTAFIGSYGKGKPIIAILGEFDALPGLSQQMSSAEKSELQSGGNGHGCGHNLLGAGALAAAVAVKDYISETGISGTVRYYGCPGEENGAGKTFMAREGLFDDADAALCWHPGDVTVNWGISTLVNLSAYFKFKGVSAHAAGAPHLGRSALDAVELMNVGANYLREHIIPDARIHYAITNTGGSAPNVVQQSAEVYYYIRAPKVYQAQEIYSRICEVAKGAAMMTGTSVEIEFAQGLSDYIPSKTIGEIMYNNLIKAGPPDFDQQDLMLAQSFRQTLDEQDIKNTMGLVDKFQGSGAAKLLESKPLADSIGPFIHLPVPLPGSTDVGDVSYVVPTAQIYVACSAIGTAAHTWQMTAQAASSIGHKGMLAAGKTIAMTAVELLYNTELLRLARLELNEITGGQYVCPIPEHIKPCIQ